jgi:CMP-N-acetylneuraminic acid synthetase
MKNTSIFDGRIGMHEVSPQNAIDIDSELEFRIAEFLLKERLSSGS